MTYRGRTLVVELHPRHLTLREKGRRQALTVGWDAIYHLAWKILARTQADEKAAQKKGRGKRP
jgi:hypothetical protein